MKKMSKNITKYVINREKLLSLLEIIDEDQLEDPNLSTFFGKDNEKVVKKFIRLKKIIKLHDLRK